MKPRSTFASAFLGAMVALSFYACSRSCSTGTATATMSRFRLAYMETHR